MNNGTADSTATLAKREPLTFSKYLPIASLYFFFNSVGLPFGLLYTTLLSPFLYVWLVTKKKKFIISRFVVASLPFVVAHIYLGIDSKIDYARSYALWMCIYVTAFAFCCALNSVKNLSRMFHQIAVANFVFAVIAVAIRFTSWRGLLWTDERRAGVDIMRLKLLTYEPSYYALLMTPLLFFVVFRFIVRPRPSTFLYTVVVCVPFLLGESFGGLSIGLFSLAVAQLGFVKHLVRRPAFLIATFTAGVAIILALSGTNSLAARVSSVFEGDDSSTQVRTVYSYALATHVASLKSVWWGVGFGQFKVLGERVVATGEAAGFEKPLIPNAVVGTLAECGLVGLLLRLTVEIVLFFRTRTYLNCFRAAVFTAAFIWQFTGSYVTNIGEYVMWILAFSPVFPEMGTQALARRFDRAKITADGASCPHTP